MTTLRTRRFRPANIRAVLALLREEHELPVPGRVELARVAVEG